MHIASNVALERTQCNGHGVSVVSRDRYNYHLTPMPDVFKLVCLEVTVREELANSDCDDIDLRLFDGLDGDFGTPMPLRSF